MELPKVSVIIPLFNAAKYIPQTLETLLNQTMKDFEVVVVDDCSTDNSVEVVESFMDRFAAQGISLHLIELQAIQKCRASRATSEFNLLAANMFAS